MFKPITYFRFTQYIKYIEWNCNYILFNHIYFILKIYVLNIYLLNVVFSLLIDSESIIFYNKLRDQINNISEEITQIVIKIDFLNFTK